MGQPQFVHLHVHTDYSLLDGACETTELLDEASRQKMPAVAITDHGNLFAAANFFYEASKRDVKPIIGCEVYVAKGSRHDRGEKGNGVGNGQDRSEAEPSGGRGSNHLVQMCIRDRFVGLLGGATALYLGLAWIFRCHEMEEIYGIATRKNRSGEAYVEA